MFAVFSIPSGLVAKTGAGFFVPSEHKKFTVRLNHAAGKGLKRTPVPVMRNDEVASRPRAVCGVRGANGAARYASRRRDI